MEIVWSRLRYKLLSGYEIMEKNNQLILKLTTKILMAYLANNKCGPEEITDIFDNIYNGLRQIEKQEENRQNSKVPAVPVENSIQQDKIICLEDGKSFKMLKRHLASNYKMTPEEYRLKWNLPVDYPMVAPSYSKKRQQLAKQIGLGKTDN